MNLLFVLLIAWFVVIFGINTTSDISKLLYVISRAVRRSEWNLRQFWNITSGIYAKYHIQIILLFVYTTTHKRFVIFTCRYFKVSWNTTALSQSNCSNFSCSSIKMEFVASCRFQIHLCTSACVMSSEFTREVVMRFLPAQFSWIWCKCLQSNSIHSKIFQSDRIQGRYRKKYTAHYACRNADLNLMLVGATTNGFIFQIIDSLMESWGVHTLDLA